MEKLKTFETFDPTLAIDNFLNDPFMITLVTAWFLNNKLSINNIKDNSITLKREFISYANALGYTIDEDTLDYKFFKLIEKIKNILKK